MDDDEPADLFSVVFEEREPGLLVRFDKTKGCCVVCGFGR